MLSSQLGNSVFHQISAANLHALQYFLNAAAHLVMRKRKYDHITATLRDDLHWLPIRQLVMYKLCTIVHKCLHAAAPPYLSELCIPVSTSVGRHFLRSATYGDLLVPRTSTSTYGPRSFAVSGLSVWNVTCDSACITDTWTVSKQAEGSTFSLGLRDMTRRVRDCLG